MRQCVQCLVPCLVPCLHPFVSTVVRLVHAYIHKRCKYSYIHSTHTQTHYISVYTEYIVKLST
jgi:hypothetical protein